MELEGSNVEKKLGKIHFKYSVKEIVESQKTQAIKYILNTVDLTVEPDVKNSKARQAIRKAVLDNINDLTRVFQNMIDSLVDVKDADRDKVQSECDTV